MSHTAGWRAKRWMGTAKVELANGKKLTFGVYKQGRTFWLESELVNPANSGSVDQAIRYIGVIHGSPVKEWEWEHLRGVW